MICPGKNLKVLYFSVCKLRFVQFSYFQSLQDTLTSFTLSFENKMAKSKRDFYHDGYSEFIHNLPMPTGSSWQELAKAEGWIAAAGDYRKEVEGVAGRGVPIDSPTATDALAYALSGMAAGLEAAAKTSKRFAELMATRTHYSDSEGFAQYHHIKKLREMAAKLSVFNVEENIKAHRYLAKANRLEIKWNKRGVVFQ